MNCWPRKRGVVLRLWIRKETIRHTHTNLDNDDYMDTHFYILFDIHSFSRSRARLSPLTSYQSIHTQTKPSGHVKSKLDGGILGKLDQLVVNKGCSCVCMYVCTYVCVCAADIQKESSLHLPMKKRRRVVIFLEGV